MPLRPLFSSSKSFSKLLKTNKPTKIFLEENYMEFDPLKGYVGKRPKSLQVQ